MTAEPSSRPWRAEQPGDECRFWTVRNPDGVSVCTAWREADAALIVDAVNAIDATKRLAVKLYDPIKRAEAERDRLRGLVRRLSDNISRYHLVGERERALLREARAAIGEDGP